MIGYARSKLSSPRRWLVYRSMLDTNILPFKSITAVPIIDDYKALYQSFEAMCRDHRGVVPYRKLQGADSMCDDAGLC